jgi:hypothetical protein
VSDTPVVVRLRYVNRDHRHPFYGRIGVKVAQGRGPGPRNTLVRMDDGTEVIAPWGNWRKEASE